MFVCYVLCWCLACCVGKIFMEKLGSLKIYFLFISEHLPPQQNNRLNPLELALMDKEMVFFKDEYT